MQFTAHHKDKIWGGGKAHPGAFLISHDDGFITCVTWDDPAWPYFMFKVKEETPKLFAAVLDRSREFSEEIQIKLKEISRMTKNPGINGFV